MTIEKAFFWIVVFYALTAGPLLIYYSFVIEPSCIKECNNAGYDLVIGASVIGKPGLECTCFVKNGLKVISEIKCNQNQECQLEEYEADGK